MKITESNTCVEQYRFPSSKKKRIRNKWAKRPENFRPSKNAYVMHIGSEQVMVMHPVFAAHLRNHLAGQNKTTLNS